MILDASWFQGQSDRAYALNPFSIDAQVYSGLSFLPSWMKGLESRLSRRYSRNRLGASIYREPHFHFDSNYPLLNRPVYLEGFWQSEQYFFQYKDLIRSDLLLKGGIPERFLLAENLIRSTDSICIHIRRGDYVSNPIALQTHGVCSIDYIHRGLQAVSADLIKPHCFIFSDDPEWVKDNLVLTFPHMIVDIAKPHEAHFDLALMAQCKHFVIANSSLSWWGAWLSENTSKRVVAPKNWFANHEKNINDLIPAGWIQL
ncbi:alpha-1,2-fucosyltransferase [Polynucleobacter paneuropaeus]|uniref:Alpha-1,2-fucosyltransferase n=1 Tax=Polynucleobacter paneuropaeus TaxID=2527775 RepID=A0A9Q2WKQ4_9BURK|nr:alpha-1,2-fucosyltransferase [Polynucleobacter paneuropaeus]